MQSTNILSEIISANSAEAMMKFAQLKAAEIVARARAGAPSGFDPKNEGTVTADFGASARAIEETREGMRKLVTGLNGLNLHESLKPHVTGLIGTINSALKKMPPLEAHRAASDMHYAVNSLNDSISRCQSMLDSMGEMVTNAMTSCQNTITAKDSSLNGLVTDGVQKEIDRRIKAGELFEKATVEGLTSTAKTQGRDVAVNELRVTSTRRQELTEAKIPLPMPASESILAGTDAEFTAVKTEATKRLAALNGMGIAVNEHTDGMVRRLLYTKSYEDDLSLIKGMLGMTTQQQTPGTHLIGPGAPGGAPGKLIL